MRSKAPLALMEQTVMLLVFALAAALCLRAFVWSGQTSRHGEARDRAAVAAQTAAEVIKHEGEQGGAPDAVLAAAAERLGGSYDPETRTLALYYDGDWNLVSDAGQSVYRLAAQEAPGGVPGLGLVRVWVTGQDGEDVLFDIQTAWQTEVGA